MKRVIFTESQIKSILGEDVFDYSRNGSPSEEGGHGLDRVSTTQQVSKTDSKDEKRGTGPTTDKTSEIECPRGFGYGATSTRTHITEENSQINRNFKANGQSASVGQAAWLKHKQDVEGQELNPTEKSLVRQVDSERKRIKDSKKLMSKMGMPNQFQKAGGTRNNGGKAHTPKINNGTSITYFN